MHPLVVKALLYSVFKHPMANLLWGWIVANRGLNTKRPTLVFFLAPHETSPIKWIGKPAPVILCYLSERDDKEPNTAVVAGGGGVKTTENKIHRPRWLRICMFFFIVQWMVTWGRRISQLFQLETRGRRSEVNKRTVIVMDTPPLCFPPLASTKHNTAKRSAGNRGSREAQGVATKVWCGGGGAWEHINYEIDATGSSLFIGPFFIFMRWVRWTKMKHIMSHLKIGIFQNSDFDQNIQCLLVV